MGEPNDDGLPAKLYFRIGEVAELVGVEPHVLRYWEREFRAIRPSKSARGQRVYSRRDVENLMRVRQLLYGEGFTIAGAKKKLRAATSPGGAPAAPAALDAAQARNADDVALREDVAPQEPEEAQLRGLLEARGAHDAEETRETRETRPTASVSPRAREQLVALRAEIEDFLAELEPTPAAAAAR